MLERILDRAEVLCWRPAADDIVSAAAAIVRSTLQRRNRRDNPKGTTDERPRENSHEPNDCSGRQRGVNRIEEYRRRDDR